MEHSKLEDFVCKLFNDIDNKIRIYPLWELEPVIIDGVLEADFCDDIDWVLDEFFSEDNLKDL